MYHKPPTLRLNTVRHYLNNGDSLRTTAQKFNLSYKTVFKWVKWYREEGTQRLHTTYKIPWNKFPKDIEEKIVMLKEREPTLTIQKAQEILARDGITISIKGVWGVWKRYGYAGFKKENMTNNFMESLFWTKESKAEYERAEELANLGRIKDAAEIVNSIPSLPGNELLVRIPDMLLNERRRVEKMSCLFGKTPLPSYIKETEKLYEELKRKGLFYSLIRVGIMQIIALEWSGKPLAQLQLIEELKKTIERNNAAPLLFAPEFALLISEGIANSFLMRIEKSNRAARMCSGLMKRRKQPSPYFMIDLYTLYYNLEDYTKAEYWLLRALDRADKDITKLLTGKFSQIQLLKGKYKKALQLSKNAEFAQWGSRFWRQLFQSQLSLNTGFPQKAITLAAESLSLTKKGEFNIALFNSYLTMASALCSIGERKKAMITLKKIAPFIEKNKLRKETMILNILLSQNEKSNAELLMSENISPTIKILLLLSNSQYRQALSYAQKKGIQSYLHRFIFFYPEAVTTTLSEGESTGLPKQILRLPAFNKKAHVYNIKFLGNLTINKDEQRINVKLTPKDLSFIIHLALRLAEPQKNIPLDDIYNNFWKRSRNPSRNLSHLLIRIKKALKLPSHLLEVSYKGSTGLLVNRGIHFVTDYDEFRHTLTQARVFKRANEWKFAEKEYMNAFSLCRGEPFTKMYDDWSDDKRLEILFSYESEVVSFGKELIKRGRKKEAEHFLRKATKIIPFSDEFEEAVWGQVP
jgi:transposase